MKKLLAYAVSLAFAWLVSGCFQTETWTTVDSKGGMQRKIDIQIGKDSKDQLKAKKESFEKEGWKVSEEEKDGKYHLIAEKKWEDGNQFASPFNDSKIKIEKKDKKVFFSEEFDSKKSAGITDTSRSAWHDLKYTFHVTMPGKVDNSNADKKDGNTATWEIDYNKVFDVGMITMTADSSEGGGICGSTMFITGIGLGLFLFAARLIFKWIANRKKLKIVTQN
ncbi:hypothetical protein K1X84_10110 [bacterium]|nr:hypothetical protein [bacterium]